MNARYSLKIAGAAMLLSTGAQAQDSLLAGEDASSGSTEVAGGGFEATAAPNTENDATEVKFSAGGLFASGNSRSVAATGAAKVRLRRQKNQYTGDIAANYAESAPDVSSDREATVENYQMRLRYDRFLSDRWALFAAESLRRDRFQGLGLRMNFDPGVAHYFLTAPQHRLWVEAGYDLQYDIRLQDAIDDGAALGVVVDTTEVRHAARLFAGYSNTINEHVLFDTGLEYLQAFADTRNWRLNWEAGLTSSLSNQFSLSATFNLRYDNNPLPEVRTLDTVTAMSLVYTLR